MFSSSDIGFSNKTKHERFLSGLFWFLGDLDIRGGLH